MGSKLFKKKRGKFDEIREERKKRRGDVARENAKRRKLGHGTADVANENDPEDDNIIENEDGDYVAFQDTTGQQPDQDEAVFYGLLTPEEQTYYSNVNSKIVSNDFESGEDRHAFIDAVYRESQDKELKLSSSQSCSRYLEKIIMLSTPDQLRTFFGKLIGNLTHLVQHRFGSHVCETLFLECGKHVTKGKDTTQAAEDITIESLLLQAAEELKPNIGYMLTDRFASHTVRVLLLVLSGEPLDDASTKALLASKRKEKIDAPASDGKANAVRTVPKSFRKAMSDLITAAVSSLDATYLRALATHPTGSPVLQLLLKLELANSDKGRQLKEDSLYHKLISPESISEGGEGAKFVSALTYDATGSHLIEVLVVHSPGKIFKKLYKDVWKPKMSSMAKNDIASYVAIKVLERLGKDELVEARDMIVPELSILLERRRTAVIKCLVDRSVVREIDLKLLAEALKKACGQNSSAVLPQLLGLGVTEETKTEDRDNSAHAEKPKADTHGSLLAQSMVQAPSVSNLIQESLLSLNTTMLLRVAQDPASSRVMQSALTSTTASVSFRKKMVPSFYDHILELSQNPVGSYVVDALWAATNGLHFMKERVAKELAAHESELRDSLSGRNVWRNWSMDVYQRRPAEWRNLARGQDQHTVPAEKAKTPFEKAQERHVEQKAKEARQFVHPSRTVPASA